jgi:hypothetical protein
MQAENLVERVRRVVVRWCEAVDIGLAFVFGGAGGFCAGRDAGPEAGIEFVVEKPAVEEDEDARIFQ